MSVVRRLSESLRGATWPTGCRGAGRRGRSIGRPLAPGGGAGPWAGRAGAVLVLALAAAAGPAGAAGLALEAGPGAAPSVRTASRVDDWDLPGMKVVRVRNLEARPIEVTSYRLYDCRNVGLVECETDTPARRVIGPGEEIELVVVGPILSTSPQGPPPVSFRYAYSARLR